MNWLTENGIWVLITIAGLWLFMRRGGLHGHGMGGHHGQSDGNTRHGHGGVAGPAPGDAPAEAGAALDR